MSEKAPEISACEAITVAIVASTASGQTAHSGAMRKNGLPTSSPGLLASRAA